ncbi:MAG: phosphoribosylglycinamide formyltransferase [Planctomycetota bacterium]|nr:MAG: phosphoribosylglycinamide formyltransferase [Planctomycetota bacterium]
MPRPIKLAVLISGGGTTLKNLIDKIDAGQLNAQIVVVISNTPHAKGLRFAEEAGIEHHVLDWNRYESPEKFSQDVFALCRSKRAKLVVLAGFLKKLVIPNDFFGRVVNIHPALIPAFCGKGFYGRHVHEAVLKYGAKLSGCTVHFADNEYDHGPIILQKVVPVLDDDTPETLAARVFEAECEAYPEAIRLIAENRVEIRGRKVYIHPAESDEEEELP